MELHRGVLEPASAFVEHEPQTRIEGALQRMPAGSPVTEFGPVLTDAAPPVSSTMIGYRR